MRPNTASDTTQKHDVLQIITIMKNCELEYSTKEVIFAENIIKHVIHGHKILHALVHFQSAQILFLKFILNT